MTTQATHAEFTRDDIYEALSNQRRRFVMHYLQQYGHTGSLGTIAEHVAAWENSIDLSAVGSGDRKNVYTSLQQFHLPKMEDIGLIIFDQRAGTIELSQAAADIDIYTELVGRHELPWSMYYLSLGGIGGSIVTGSTVGTIEFIDIDPLASAIFTVTSISVLAVIHTYYMHQDRIGENEKPPEVAQ